MKFPSSRSLTSLGGVVAFVLIAGILVFMARSQDVRALLASWNGFNADQIGIYNQLVKLQSAGELNYDEVSMSLFESANYQQTYRTELQQYYPYISKEFDAGLAQDFRRFESSVEDFNTQLALTRNSTRFLIQRKTEVLSQTNLSDAGKHKLELDIINFALKPTPFNSGAIDRALIQISATYVGDDALLEAFKQHKQKVLEGYSDTLTLIDRIDGLISVSTFNTVAQKLENELEVYSRSVNGFAVSLIALILALLVRVVMFSRRAENAVKELSSLNEEFDAEEKTYDFSGRRVLLVDDNAINRTVAELMLDTVGVEVIMAEDGKQAVDTLNEQSIDLVFMDYQMPVMDGYEASRTIRQFSNPLKRDVPIVAMTANAMKGDKEMCLEAGMDDYISKPVEAQLLYELISKWLDHTHSEGIVARD